MKLEFLRLGSGQDKALGRLGSGLVILLALLVLGGCASTDDSTPDWAGVKGDEEPAKLAEFREAARFEVRWHNDVGDPGAELLPIPGSPSYVLQVNKNIRNPGAALLQSAPTPALTNDAIYSATGRGSLMRLDRATGKQVWRIQTGLIVSGGVASGEGLVLVGGDKGEVWAYDEDGKLKWKSLVSSEVLSVSQVTDGRIMVRSGDGRIAGLNAVDGKRVWIYERSTPALVVRNHAGVAIQRGVAYAGFAGGKLAAINIKDGEVLWEVMVSQPRGNTELERISDITSDPVVDDEQVCAVAFQGRVACYDAVQGSPLWNRDLSGDKGMMVLRKYLYLSETGGSVIALDKTTGSTTWRNGQLLWRGITAPYALGNFVVVGDSEGYLHGLNREDGILVSRIKLDGGAIMATPVEMDGGLLVQTRGGELYSLSIK